jgi:hypothetical protein
MNVGEFFMMAHGMGRDIWTLTPDAITRVVMVGFNLWPSLITMALADTNVPYTVHMDHPSLLRPSLNFDQDNRLGLLHTRLPCERIPACVLGHNCLLRSVDGVDDDCGNSYLHTCRSRLDCLDWKRGGCVLCQQHLLVGSFGKGDTLLKRGLKLNSLQALNIATDVWILTLPIPQLLNLQLGKKKKIYLIMMFSVGLVYVHPPNK